MATFKTYEAGPMVAGAGGLREDLLDIIVNISPTETPMLSGFKNLKPMAHCMNGLLIL